jgi:acetyl esterase
MTIDYSPADYDAQWADRGVGDFCFRKVPTWGGCLRLVGQRRRGAQGQSDQKGQVPSTKNNGILLDLHTNYGAIDYGVDQLDGRNPLAWPGFATEDDVRGLPPVVISVNECDPLRDEGVNFYRLLLRAGIPARCRQVMGTVHGTEIFIRPCPDISRDTARDLAAFCAA